jgi:WD40 repeat protein
MVAAPRLSIQGNAAGHDGEVYACAFAADGRTVITGGWDGKIRVWDANECKCQTTIEASKKPISACAIMRDSGRFLAGSLDGLLSSWDNQTHQRVSAFVAHGRPISSILIDPSGKLLVTASWDGGINVWDLAQATSKCSLNGHQDTVAGCRFTPEGRYLLSWSYDGSICLWEFERAKLLGRFPEQKDRVTAGAISPDGRLAATGTRAGTVTLWNLRTQQEICNQTLTGEIRACFFLLDGTSLLVIEASGRITIHALTDLDPQTKLETGLAVQCADIAPGGNQLVVGCEDGQVRFVTLEEFDLHPLLVIAAKTSRRTATALQRFFGRSQLVSAYRCTCPVCRNEFEVKHAAPSQELLCPTCGRKLRIADVLLQITSKGLASPSHHGRSKSEFSLH